MSPLGIDPDRLGFDTTEIAKGEAARKARVKKENPLGLSAGVQAAAEEIHRETQRKNREPGRERLRVVEMPVRNAELRSEAATQRSGDYDRRVAERQARMVKRARGERIKGLVTRTFLEYQRKSAVDRMLANERGGVLKEIGRAAFGAALMEWLGKGKGGEARFKKMQEGLLKGNERVLRTRGQRLRELTSGGRHKNITEAIKQRDAWNRRVHELLDSYDEAHRSSSRSRRRMAA